MKNWILLVIIVALLAGFTTADPGIDPVLETQGLSMQTVVSAFGAFSHKSEVVFRSTNSIGGLNSIPPLEGATEGSIDVSFDPLVAIFQGENQGAVYYASVYTEDTDTNGLGEIGYTKDLGINTKAMVTGQSNIEAVKQIVYLGEPGSKVLSTDFISIDGAGSPSPSARFGLALNTDPPEPGELSSNKFICPFAGGTVIPAFCSHVESGSSIDMNVADVATTMNARFIVPSADTPVSLNNNIQVSNSLGKVSAGIDAKIREGGNAHEDLFPFSSPPITICTPDGGCEEYLFTGWVGIISSDLAEELNIHDFTSFDGTVVTFTKSMSYTSRNVL